MQLSATACDCGVDDENAVGESWQNMTFHPCTQD